MTARPGHRLDLCNPGTIQAVARRFGLGLKPSWGQHFLCDASVVERIVEALAPRPEDDVFEIGTGLGTLTAALARQAGRVVTVEVDPHCVRATAVTLRGLVNVRVVQGDARVIDPRVDAGFGDGYLAAGNLPYQLTGILLRRLFERVDPPRRAVFLIQREVAARLAADPGGWSLSTVAMRSVATVERIADVPAAAFLPRPAVTSSIIRVMPAPSLEPAERAAVLHVARAAFQLRRKTLRHGVTRALAGDGAGALAALCAADIEPSRRPGTLTLAEWRRLAGEVVRPS